MRINKAEIEAANWINKNLEYYNNTIRYRDVITYSNAQFFYVLTDKRVFGSTKAGDNGGPYAETGTIYQNYAVFDYIAT